MNFDHHSFLKLELHFSKLPKTTLDFVDLNRTTTSEIENNVWLTVKGWPGVASTESSPSTFQGTLEAPACPGRRCAPSKASSGPRTWRKALYEPPTHGCHRHRRHREAVVHRRGQRLWIKLKSYTIPKNRSCIGIVFIQMLKNLNLWK